MSIEFDLIRRFFYRQLDQANGVTCGIGDDAAVLNIPDGYELAVSMDTLVAGIHFFSNTPAVDIGYKSLAVNLSDMAAMGADPKWLTLSLTLPERDESWLQGFMDGVKTISTNYSLSLIGGDLCHGPLSITFQVHGLLPAGHGLFRHSAKPGDLIYVSGTLGDAGMALQLLTGNKFTESADHQFLRSRLERPEPKVKLGMALLDIANSAIDISDGLVTDLAYITEASHIGAEIHLEKIPLSEAYLREADQNPEIALTAGDDYELCFTVPPENTHLLDELIMAGHPISCIGEITEGQDIKWLDANGNRVAMKTGGYSHFI